MKYYYDNETDTIVSDETIRNAYDMFGEDYESYDDYLACCMWFNNGTLTDVSDKLDAVKRELNRKLVLAQKYGYDEYADELANLLAEMDELRKYGRR